jgi:uncharacterized C2H2 Zn-finger protein
MSTPRRSGLDRVRPRTPDLPAVTGAAGHDAEGKRALFSATGSGDRPGAGSVLVECSRCGQRTVLAPARALRAAWPSVHLALRVGHGGDVTTVGVSGRDYPTFMRCPECGRPSWVRFTIQL